MLKWLKLSAILFSSKVELNWMMLVVFWFLLYHKSYFKSPEVDGILEGNLDNVLLPSTGILIQLRLTR